MKKEDIFDEQNLDEDELKNKLFSKLNEYGKGEYADDLKDFDLNLSRVKARTGGVASIDVENGIINLDLDFLDGKVMKDDDGNPKKPSWEFITGVIKHELLHSIRKHLYQSVDILAKELGFTKPLSQEELNVVYQVRARANELFKMYNAKNTWNFAGDADLAQLYTEREINEFRTIGGIIRQDYPEFDGLSYEEVARLVDKRGFDTEIRASKKHYGKLNQETGEWENDHDEDSEFAPGYNNVRVDDIATISLPRLIYRKDIKALANIGYFNGDQIIWTEDKAPEEEQDGKHVKMTCLDMSKNTVEYKDINRYAIVHAVLKIWNLASYDNEVIEFNVGGESYLRLVYHPGLLISKDEIKDESGNYMIPYSHRGRGSSYTASEVKKVLDNYLDKLKKSNLARGGK